MSTILVIEDTQDNFDLIEDALEGRHELVHAKSGQEGLMLANTLRPDLILLDMGLPGLSGWDVVRCLRTDHAFKHTPVVAITAHAMNGDREKCLAAGCNDYMSKPVNIAQLVSSVERHLNPEEKPVSQ